MEYLKLKKNIQIKGQYVEYEKDLSYISKEKKNIYKKKEMLFVFQNQLSQGGLRMNRNPLIMFCYGIMDHTCGYPFPKLR